MSDSELSIKRQLDTICDEFEQQWSAEKRPDFQAFANRVETEHRARLLRMLIEIDVELRQKVGQTILADDYQAVAHDAKLIVEQLLDNGPPTRSLPDGDQTQDFDANPTDATETLASDAEQTPNEVPTSVGRYRIEGVLGQGGFGLVYKAYDDQLQRHVAVKVPHARLIKRPEDAEAYLTEARTVANLEHPNIVPVHDIGESDQFPCFVVSRFIEGTDLSDRIKQQPLAIGDAVELVATVAEALHYAHKQGLVHRDVKPGNILLGNDGKPYLVDFGLALKEQKVGTGAEYAGTPAYMSPEQARGEGHRVDGRSDIYSLGVVLYELLTGKRTFRADSAQELLKKVSSLDVKPPRQINDAVPRELERICLKALSRRASDRYTTVLDLAEDMRHFLQEEFDTSLTETQVLRTSGQEAESTKGGIDTATPQFDSDSREIRVVPKGLRSFDAHDADFFLELLPGPRDRDGLPDSIRFWKTKIEEMDPDLTFSIGLIYGPSGCGKSSLVKAGLIPRLSDDVIAVYIEATPDETESRLLHGLRKACPGLDSGLGLVDSLTAIRQGLATTAGKKVLIIIDQFEQWLHAKKEDENTELVQALRQCDGARLQCVVMVRDDFWMAATRYMRELEIRLLEGENSAAVDLFPIRHAKKVLKAFGRAFGALDSETDQLNEDQKQFIKQLISGLSEEGKVICVRLALFSEMMKGKSWTPATLAEVGGTSGVGVTFLEETFSASTAPPEHRYHQKAARGVLKALLPDSGTDIKGEMKSREELLKASGYEGRPQDVDDLIRILDSEIRLITPTDPEGIDGDDDSTIAVETGQKYYQLTHDYLVHSLRDWLTRKQRETRRGRSELLLAERSATWNSKRENRQLPSTLEWLRIHALTPSANWTAVQRTMMQRANRVKGVFWAGVAALMLVIGIGIQQGLTAIERQSALDKTRVRVASLQDVSGSGISLALENLDELPRDLVLVELQNRFPKTSGQQKLKIAYGLAHLEQVEIDTMLDGLINPDTDPDEVDNIVNALRHNESDSLKQIKAAVEVASYQSDWSTKTRLAIAALHLGDHTLAAEMLRDQPERTTPRIELPDLLADFRKQVEQVTSLPDDQRSAAGIRLKLAVAYYFLDQDKEALVEFEPLASGGSANWEVWLRQAICLARIGKAEDARASLEQLSEATRTPSLIAYANILVEAWLGNLDEAEKQLNQMIADSPEDSTAQYNSACIAAQLVRVCRQKNQPGDERFKQLALQRLRSAYTELGYSGSSGIDNDADFIPLRQDQDFLSLVGELKPPAITFDPIQRTVFIREFADWSGAVKPLAELLAGTENQALRSGICLSVSGVAKPGQDGKEKWQQVLDDWYTNAADSGTHSAAGWALSQWKLEKPKVTTSKNPAADRAWWHEPNGLSFAKITAGNVTCENGPIMVAQDYWLSDSEITVGMFKQFMADEAYHKLKPELKPDWDGGHVFENDNSPELPVQEVSWYDAVLFCNWLSWKLELEPCYEIKKTPPAEPATDEAPVQNSQKSGGRERREPFVVTWQREANGIRLPTSAEWEYACRTSTTTRFSFCADEKDLLDYGWFGLNSNSRSHMIRTKLCNAWGLFDMHGNVEEWCWGEGSDRVSRGGSWRSIAWRCRSSYRGRNHPTIRPSFLGFRVARGPSSQASPASE